MHQIVGRERISRLRVVASRSSLGAQAEDDAGGHDGIPKPLGGGNRHGTERHPVQLHATPALESSQVHTEVVQGQIGDGDASVDVLHVDDRLLELEQLLAPVLQVVHLVAGLVLNDVLLAGGGDIQQHHAPAHPLLQVDVLVQLHVGPEVDQLDAGVGRADAVDAPEALDDAHRVPVDVVVDQTVAVLKVLAFGDAVGGDEQIQFAFLGQLLRALLGAG